MPALIAIDRPKGQRDDYLFAQDPDTGQRFKVTHQMQTNDGAQPVLAISLSPVGADGKALLNAAGQPDVTTHMHVFTAVELADPAFDEEARVAEIITQLAADKQNEIAARERVLGIGKKWGKGTLDLAKRLPPGPSETGEPT